MTLAREVTRRWRQKRKLNHDPSVPFIEEVALRPEQYRAVTFPKDPETVGAYQYPAVAAHADGATETQ